MKGDDQGSTRSEEISIVALGKLTFFPESVSNRGFYPFQILVL